MPVYASPQTLTIRTIPGPPASHFLAAGEVYHLVTPSFLAWCGSKISARLGTSDLAPDLTPEQDEHLARSITFWQLAQQFAGIGLDEITATPVPDRLGPPASPFEGSPTIALRRLQGEKFRDRRQTASKAEPQSSAAEGRPAV